MRAIVSIATAGLAAASAAVGCYGGLDNLDAQRLPDASAATKSCAPGDVKECPCPHSGVGTQTCSRDGGSWGVCDGCTISGGDSGPSDALPDQGGTDADESDGGAEGTADTGLDAAEVDAGTPDGGFEDAGPVNDGGAAVDGGTPMQPEDRRPCDKGTCWKHDATLWRCGSFGIDENFGTGKYNVHAYASRTWAGAPTLIALERTRGTWQPALIVSDATDGTVLFDGAVGLRRQGLDVSIVQDGRSGSRAEIKIATADDLSVTVHVTAWSVVLDGFAGFLPTDAAYGLSIGNDCGGQTVACVVNGRSTGAAACGWLHYIARNVVPLLDGSRDERLTNSARVAWWSLKEGVLYRPNPLSYSHCAAPGTGYIDPLEVCPDGYAWQVGLSGTQVRYSDLVELEATALRIFSGRTVEEVLAGAAREALLNETDAASIAASTGILRQSWLLRTSAVAFTFQTRTVTSQCVDNSYAWCYGTGWDSTTWFAPDREHALLAMEDVRQILAAVAP